MGDPQWSLGISVQHGSILCTLMYELLYYRQTYVIINWQILTFNPGVGLHDEVNQLQMGIYNIEENSWTITPLFGFSISGGKS